MDIQAFFARAMLVWEPHDINRIAYLIRNWSGVFAIQHINDKHMIIHVLANGVFEWLLTAVALKDLRDGFRLEIVKY